MSPATRWTIRGAVLVALALTVWLCGPRAVAVLAARLELADRNSPTVVLDRVGFVQQPSWMDRATLVAVAAAVSPWLGDEVPILDETTGQRLRDGLASVPWVRGVQIERVFPDRFRLRFELRRPVLAVRSADGDPLCLVDGDAVMLPWVDTPVPMTVLHREGGRPSMAVVPGQVAEEPRVRAAAAIAVEWRDGLAPLVDGCPRLLEVDATNLGERWLSGPSYPEIRVKVQRRDGAAVVLGYGRPVDSALQRVPLRTKATVLQCLLANYSMLDGLVAADLRFARRWLDYVQPRPPNVRDPNAPWTELPR